MMDENLEGGLPPEITVQEVRSLLDGKADFLLLDCREREEWDLVRIEGAQWLPMSEIQARLDELEEHKERRIVIHCHHGMRSLQVSTWLEGQGYRQCQSMSGGIDAWSVTVDPELPRYG